MRRSWQRPHFGSSLRDGLARFGLIEAPRRKSMSDAMCDLMERDAQAAARAEAEAAEWAEESRRRRDRERRAQLQALVQAYGARTVETILRRADPNFSLPADLVISPDNVKEE